MTSSAKPRRPDVLMSMQSGALVAIDAIVHSEAGARWLSGARGVKLYREDPTASVFERVVIRGNVIGMVA